MAISFTGTATGNQYTVGQQYTANGNTYTAQADGSFRRDDRPGGGYQSGSETLAGSSGNLDVTWSASGGDSLREHFASLGYPVQAAASSGSQRSENPGTSAAINAGAVPVQNPQVNRNRQTLGSFVQQAAAGWSGADDPPQDNLFWGVHIRANPNTTNAQMMEDRYGDLVSAVAGVGTLAADAVNTIWHNRRNIENAAAVGANDAGNAFVNAMLGTMGAIDQWGRENARYEQNRDRIERELQEAYDLRDQLQAEEAARYEARQATEFNVIQNIGIAGNYLFNNHQGGGGAW